MTQTAVVVTGETWEKKVKEKRDISDDDKLITN